MTTDIESFYNIEEGLIDAKKYANWYLNLISTILPFFNNDNIKYNSAALIVALKENFGFVDRTANVIVENFALEFHRDLLTLDIRITKDFGFIDIHRPDALKIFCTLAKVHKEYIPNSSQADIRNKFLHFDKLVDIPESYITMTFEQDIN